MTLEPYDLDLLIEALAHRASRLETMANRNKWGRNQDMRAAEMRQLRTRLIELRPTNVANSC